MDFHRLLYTISEALDTENLNALKFLCLEQIPLRMQEGISDSKDLFLKLQEKHLLHEEDLSFLQELLFRIDRIDLLKRELGVSREEIARQLQIPGRATVSPYRHMLFELSENVTKQDLNDLKFLISELPKWKLHSDTTTMLDIFIEMEKKGILGEDNLDILKEKCEKIDKGLVKNIEDYQRKAISGEMGNQTEEPRPTELMDVQETFGDPGTPTLCTNDSPGHTGELFQTSQFYKMSSRPRGVCLILNNRNFTKARAEVPRLCRMKDRLGTDTDADALCKVFAWLHFKIEVCHDLTAAQIHQTMQSYSAMNHKDSDCFVCCILSHGDKGTVWGTDGQEVAIRKLTSYFTGLNCPSLVGKPKVFFIQACQGEAYHRGVDLEPDGRCPTSLYEVDSNPPGECIPDEADFLLGMATVKEYVSYRSPVTGTWYIQSLCNHLRDSCPRGDDILTILTKVNHEVSTKYDKKNNGKQMPQPSFTLRKKLIFPVN
nr:caspase 8 [Andrias davidianus]